jgi:3'(2'), 5'-bisphosphate nucleotidase
MPYQPLSALIPELCSIALSAGEEIMTIYRRLASTDAAAIGLTAKTDGSPLTQADLASHRCIVARLHQLTPELPVVSEEDSTASTHRRGDNLHWLIDPLDGTKEFLNRNDEFTVNIALIDHGKTIFGVVLAPALGELYWGGQEFGAHRRTAAGTTAIRVNSAVTAPIRVVASKSHMSAETRAFIEQLGPSALVQAGSSLKFCRVAEGKADIYPRHGPTAEWDTAAGHAVLEGAGGVVSDVSGKRLSYGKLDHLNPHFIAVCHASLIKWAD